jgi:hypothetical protein
MKLKVIISIAALTIGLMFYQTVTDSNTALSNTGGAPAGRAGDPAGGSQTCRNSCHSSGPAPIAQTGWITSNIPVSGYTAGSTYTITATITRAGHSKFGFEVSPQSTAGVVKGTLTVTSSQTHLTSGNTNYITQSSTGTSGTGSKSWTFNWTAPATGQGPVTFYGAFNATNSNNSDTGDSIFTSTLVVSECAVTVAPGTITGSTTICSGSSNTYSIAAVSGASSYTWTLPSGWTGTSTSTSITTVASTTSGSVSVKANNACGSSSAKTLAVTVNSTAAPTVSIAQTSGVNPTCAGSSVTFTATPTNGGLSPAYQWKVNGSNVGTNSATYTSTTIANNNAITCVLTSNASCVSTTTATSNSITMTTTTPATPAVSAVVTSGANPTCAGSSVTFTATATSGGSIPSYQWKVNNSNVGTNSNKYTSTTWANNDVVKCVLTSNASCVSSTTATSGSITMVVNALPTISQTGSVLTSSAATGNQWYLDGSIISTATGKTYTATQSGNYTVIANGNGCSSLAFNFINTGIESINEANMFSIYPNPSKGNFIVVFNEKISGKISIEIESVVGKLLLKKEYDSVKSDEPIHLEIPDVTAGLYLLKIQSEQHNYIRKILVN